jgi:hypothetical protein
MEKLVSEMQKMNKISGDGSQSMRQLRMQMESIPIENNNLEATVQAKSEDKQNFYNTGEVKGRILTQGSDKDMNQTLS